MKFCWLLKIAILLSFPIFLELKFERLLSEYKSSSISFISICFFLWLAIGTSGSFYYLSMPYLHSNGTQVIDAQVLFERDALDGLVGNFEIIEKSQRGLGENILGNCLTSGGFMPIFLATALGSIRSWLSEFNKTSFSTII